MLKDKVFTVEILDDNAIKRALALHARIIVCYEENYSISLPQNTTLVNAEIYRVEGTWKAYEYNKRIVKQLLQKHPKYFTVDGVSIEKAMCKLLYWTNYKTGALQYASELLYQDLSKVNAIEYLPGSKWKGILKYTVSTIRNRFKSSNISNKEDAQVSDAKIGILVNDEFELKLYKGIIGKLHPKDFILFHYGNIAFENIEFITDAIIKHDLSKIVHFSTQPFINLFGLSTEELSALNSIAGNWTQIASEILRYKFIRKSGIQKLLVNVAENLPLRNLMPEVFGSSVKVFNTMNGIKSGEAHDADVFFDFWFVWDETMKALLMNSCFIPEHKLIVSGHLTQDFISEYTFQNSIGMDTNLLKSSNVISLYSVRGKRKEKLDAFEILYEFAKQNPDCLLLIKPHPLEKPSDYIQPATQLNNVQFIPEHLKNSKVALYDQIWVSDLNIVFGSTVALESLWMGVPCISFEYRKQSFVYLAGRSDILHVRTKEELKERIRSIQKRNDNKPALHSNVANKIVSCLCSLN